jgi:hypothetical protein
LKSAALMPDCPTLWNLRKRIISEIKKGKNEDEFLIFIKNEIKSISPLMLKNPKSYMLWYHRIWNLQNACEIEKVKNLQLEQSLLLQEIGLCNKFLEADDRNFHCWNYRMQIFTLIDQYFTGESFNSFLEKELEMTINLIKKNFSNFSSWHYRSKLIPIYFERIKKIDWNSEEAMDYFKSDIEHITNAIFTDPKDQSPWNYHLWLINNLTPIYVDNIAIISREEKIYGFKLSEILKIKEYLHVENDNSIPIETDNEYSNTFSVKIPTNKENTFVISEKKNGVFEPTTNMTELESQFQKSLTFSNKICFSKNNLSLPKISFEVDEEGNVITSVNNINFKQHHFNFLENQLKIIDDLIKNSDVFLEYAQYRKVQILIILYHTNKTDYKKPIVDGFNFLIEKSKRMRKMYEEMIKRFDYY